MAALFRELHRRVASRRCRYLVEVKELVKTETQDGADARLDFLQRPIHIAAQHPVQRAACLHRAVDELRKEAPVLRRKVLLAQCPRECHISVSALFLHFQQNIYRRLADEITHWSSFLSIGPRMASFFVTRCAVPGMMIFSSSRRTASTSTCVLKQGPLGRIFSTPTAGSG